MIAATNLTKTTATTHARSTSSSAPAPAAASRAPGSAMGTRIVKTAAMNPTPFAARHHVIKILNFPAGTANVYRSCGTATLMMIAVMKVTSPRIFAAIAIVQLVGDAALPITITGIICIFFNKDSIVISNLYPKLAILPAPLLFFFSIFSTASIKL